jgi:hypothetical protein
LSAGENSKKNNADRGHYVARCCGDLTPSRLLSGALVKGVTVAREVAQLLQSICHAVVSCREIGWAAAQAYRGVGVCFGEATAAAAHKWRHSIQLQAVASRFRSHR